MHGKKRKKDENIYDRSQKKLVDLKSILPGEDFTFYDFCKFISNYINPQLEPIGFLMAIENAMYDLKHKNNALRVCNLLFSDLCGNPYILFLLYKIKFFKNLYKILPQEFANEVAKLYNKFALEKRK